MSYWRKDWKGRTLPVFETIMNTNIKQHDETDCGAACIASIARYYGHNIPIAIIRESSGTSFAGTTIKGIIDSCREIGFSAKAYNSPDKRMDVLQAIGRPVILHIVNKCEDLHFVVLYKIGRKKATVMDPALGTHHKINIEELQKEWTGYLVLMTPEKDAAKCWKSSGTGSLLKYAGLVDKREWCIMMASSMVYIVAGISTALFLQHIIDRVIPAHDSAELMRTGTLMLMIMICTLFLGYGRVLYSLRLNLKMDGTLVLGYLKHLFRLPAGFFSRRGAGELNSRIGDVSKIRTFLTEGISTIVTSLLILLVSFTLMFTTHWRLALLMLLFIPIYLVLYAIAQRVNKRVNREIIEGSAAFEEKTVESITAVKVIKYFGAEDAYFRAIRKQYALLIGKLFSGGRYAGIFASWSDAISKLLTVTLLTVGSVFIFKGDLSVGALVSFYSLTAYFSTPLSNLVEISENYTEANISAERIGEIFDLEEEGCGTTDFPLDRKADLILDGISFSYPGCPTLLENFSMRIEAGKITAIQGESGCGKSSVASLLMRDYKVQKGNIFLGDTPIGLTDLEQWRKFVSIVPQDAPLMNASILDNITCLDPEPDHKRLLSIIEDLGLSKFIKELPLGLLTKVGERGSVLSGGQRQRIALARVLYRDPQIIILDEATSSLDDASQEFIIRKIQELRDKGKTIVMITHKDSNVRIADKIYNMNAHS